MAAATRRGAFIVFEGCDRSGKSTQSRLLFESLKTKGIPVKLLTFPARESSIGQVINAYLTNKQELPDEVIHLMFSANRWEYKNVICKHLEAGTTLIVDRYSYSGVAYSVAKGLKYDWCYAPEKGLVRPDVVFYLKATTDSLTDRGNYGDERYEKKEFQHKVAEVFNRIYAQEKHYWQPIDAGQTVDNLHKQISQKIAQLLEHVAEQPLELLE